MRSNQSDFFGTDGDGKSFKEVLNEVQEYISGKYSRLMMDAGNREVKEQIKRYIRQYLSDYRLSVPGMTQEELVDSLFTEMAEFSFLTKYVFGAGVEEIDVNSWKDIEVQYSNGRNEKLLEHFDSPEHAVNVVRRMLHVSGQVLDNASPVVTGQLGKNIRLRRRCWISLHFA